jgi:hypothetical protein
MHVPRISRVVFKAIRAAKARTSASISPFALGVVHSLWRYRAITCLDLAVHVRPMIACECQAVHGAWVCSSALHNVRTARVALTCGEDMPTSPLVRSLTTHAGLSCGGVGMPRAPWFPPWVSPATILDRAGCACPTARARFSRPVRRRPLNRAGGIRSRLQGCSSDAP